MYIRQSGGGSYGGLGTMWDEHIDASSLIPKTPKAYKSSDVIWGGPAISWVQDLVQMGAAAKQKSNPRNVFWTVHGPRYGIKVTGGKRAEKVPKPKKVYRPAIGVVRDLPTVKLPPIEVPEGAIKSAEKIVAQLEAEASGGFGENKPASYLPWIVLGLIIIGFLYNRAKS